MKIGVIGGGIYGSCLSYFLKKIGSEEVHLFEKNNIGGISTSKSSGMVRHHYSHRIQVEFAKRGREILENFEKNTKKLGLHQNGFLMMCSEENERKFRENIQIQKDLGIEVELIPGNRIKERFPTIDSEGIKIAALEKKGGFADPYSVANLFANKAQEKGAKMHTYTEVKDIISKNKSVVSIETSNDNYDIDFLVNAAGPLCNNISQMLGINLPLERYEAKIVVLTSDTSYDPEKPVIFDLDRGQYLKPEPGQRFISGGFKSAKNSGGKLDDINSLNDVTQEELEKVFNFIKNRVPAYSDSKLVDSWSGVITASPDWHQIIGTTDKFDNFYIVGGASGHGFKEAPGFTESIAQEILGKKTRIDLSYYRPQRFGTKSIFDSGYGKDVQAWIC